MTSSLDQHLASYPCTAAGSRALADHLRDDHGKTIYSSPYEDHAAHSAMHAAAHEAQQREPLCTCNAFHRPHPHHGRHRQARSQPGTAAPGTPTVSTTGRAPARSTAQTPPTAAAAARPHPARRSA